VRDDRATVSCFDDLPSAETLRLGRCCVSSATACRPARRSSPLWRSRAAGRCAAPPLEDPGHGRRVRGRRRCGVVKASPAETSLSSDLARRHARRRGKGRRGDPVDPDVILPFPGGIVRSGSKVGSRYRALPASTNSPYCPTLRGQVATALPDEVASVLEIVVDG